MYGRIEVTDGFVREFTDNLGVTYLEDTEELVRLMKKSNAPKECFWTCGIVDPAPGFYKTR